MSDCCTQTDNYRSFQFPASFEKLVKITEEELLMYRNDKKKLRKEILQIMTENQTIHSKTNIYSSKYEAPLVIQSQKQLANDAISILKGQLSILREERDTIQSLYKTSQNTILSLENEILAYRNCKLNTNAIFDIKTKYQSTICLLEDTITNFRVELDKQIEINKNILKEKTITDIKLKSVELKLNEIEKTNFPKKFRKYNFLAIEETLKKLLKRNHTLEKSLATAKVLVNERIFREKVTLDKLQEALLIAEIAIVEKEGAESREIIIQEEYDHLATKICRVIEEAAKKVDNGVSKLKIFYDNHLYLSEKSQKRLSNALQCEKRANQKAEIKFKSLKNKIHQLFEENTVLATNLRLASQIIVELGFQISSIDSFLNEKKINSFRTKNDVRIEMTHFLLQNKQLNDRWKITVEELAHKFKKQLHQMQKLNTNLKSENEEFKIKLNQNT